jgi:hypothetical protein
VIVKGAGPSPSQACGAKLTYLTGWESGGLIDNLGMTR